MFLNFRESHLLQILKRFENQKLPLDLFVSQYFKCYKSLGSKDRKWISESLYGMIRWKGLLNWLTRENPQWEIKLKIFKEIQINSYLNNPTIPLFARLSIPKDLLDILQKQLPLKKILHFCETSNQQAPITIRSNPIKTTRDQLLKRLATYEPMPCEQSSCGIYFPKRLPLTALPEFKEGLFEIQDEGSQILADLVPLKPGLLVLDYCAGAGGKSLAMAPKLQGKGQLFLHDVRAYALQQAKKRLARAGVQNAQIIEPKDPKLNHLQVDVVVIDAPCTGTGTFRRNPDMKWKFSKDLLQSTIDLQRQIFRQCYYKTKPKGFIAYMTCSILQEENELQVEEFLQFYPIKLIQKKSIPLSPGKSDGFFFALFEKLT